MPIHMRALLFTVLLITAPAGAASAALVPLLRLDNLVKTSDLIVIGRVTSVANNGDTMVQMSGGSEPGQAFVGSLDVGQVLKGTVDAAVLRCEFALPAMDYGYGGLAPATTVMAFLVLKGDHYEFASPYFPTLPAVSVSRPLDGSTIDRVVGALKAVVDSPGAGFQDKAWVFRALASTPWPLAKRVLQDSFNAASGRLKMEAALVLLRLDDLAALEFAVDSLVRHPKSVPADVLVNFRGHVSQFARNPDDVPLLIVLLRASESATRHAGVLALMNTRSGDAVAPLIATLSDPNVDVAYSAHLALQDITGNISAGATRDRFREDPGRYARYWQEWSASR